VHIVPILESVYRIERKILENTDGTLGAFRMKYLEWSASSNQMEDAKELRRLKRDIQSTLATSDFSGTIEQFGIFDYGEGIKSPLLNQIVLEAFLLAHIGQPGEQAFSRSFGIYDADSDGSPYLEIYDQCSQGTANGAKSKLCLSISREDVVTRLRILRNAQEISKLSPSHSCGQWGLWPLLTYYSIPNFKNVWAFQRSCFTELNYTGFDLYRHDRELVAYFYASLMLESIVETSTSTK
jgi:hypothetical protein